MGHVPSIMVSTKILRIASYLLYCCLTTCAPRRNAPEFDGQTSHHESRSGCASSQLSAAEAIKPEPKTPGLEEKSAPSKAKQAEPVTREKPTEPFTLVDDQGRPIEVYPPNSDKSQAPFVVLLHATCMQPAWVCNWFGSAGRDTGWLVCPSGNSTCAGEPDWHGPGPEKAAFLENALQKVESNLATFVNNDNGVLIGWSRGAFAARDILYAGLENPQSFPHAKRFQGLVLMAAAMKPDPSKLKEAGIKRVVMAAGDYDGSKSTMVSAVVGLHAAGIEARYVSLGKIAHVWPNDFETRMREPIAWAGGGSQ